MAAEPRKHPTFPHTFLIWTIVITHARATCSSFAVLLAAQSASERLLRRSELPLELGVLVLHRPASLCCNRSSESGIGTRC